MLVKGGCNLRFFFDSVRYSEDIDFDVAVIARETDPACPAYGVSCGSVQVATVNCEPTLPLSRARCRL